MRRTLILLGLLLITLFTSAFSLKEWRESVYEQIKTETVKELKKSFKKDIRIGRAEGIVLGQVVFRDVVIPDFARVKKIYVNFNLATLAYKRDVIPAISKITIEDAEFEVLRDKHDQLNILNLLPPEEPGAPPPPPFRAKLVFKNCRVNYQDQLGFRKDFEGFYQKIDDINGEISLQRKDRVYIELSAKIYNKSTPARLKLSGSTNLKTGKFAINVTASKVDLEKFGNYAVPFEALRFTGGKADLAIKFTPPKIKGWPASLVGNFSFYNASAEFAEYKIEKTSGKLFMEDEDLSLKDFRAQINDLPIEGSGRFSGFIKQNLDFQVSLKEASLKKLVSIFPDTKVLDLEGSGNALFNIQGTVPDPRVAGKITVEKGRFYNQEFDGGAALSFKQNLLKIEKVNISLYKGKLTGSADFDFSKELPELSLEVNLRNMDLVSLSQNSPGIEGRADGKVNLSGAITNLKGHLSANLREALFFGQPIERLSSSFQIEEGDIFLQNFSASSKTALIRSSGKISRDLNFDFQAKAQGLKFSGEGIMGEMEAVLDLFQGNVSWKLDEKFLASPLRNLKASGEARLSKGKIGEQHFDLARGKLAMGDGLIRVENATLSRKQSVLRASGQTGIGYSTRLKIIGEKINLEDLKILNHLLPEEAKDPTGYIDLELEITGEMSKETQIVSFDPLLDLNAQGKMSLTNVKTADLFITHGSLNLKWQNRVLNFSKCTFEMPDSKLSFDLSFEKENKIKGKISGIVDFARFKKFTKKYGRLEGKLGLSLVLEGTTQDPSLAASFWFRNFRFNKLALESMRGSIIYHDNKLTLPEPLLISSGPNQFEISGAANLQALRKDQPEESYLDLNIKIVKAELSSAISLFEQIQSEFSRKLALPGTGEKSKISLPLFSFPAVEQYRRLGRVVFYARNGKRKHFLKTWKAAAKEPEKEISAVPAEEMGGELTGKITLKGKIKSLSGGVYAQVRNGFYRNYTFKTLVVKASLKDKKIKIENLTLFKKRGVLTAQGEISFDGILSLGLTANNFPADILKTLFDKNFKGNLNMNASLQGPLQNLEIAASLAGRNLTLADVRFDRVSLSIAKKNSELFIHELSLLKGRNSSNVYGSIGLSASGVMSLEANLADDALGLLNLFTDQVKWIRGKASASIRLKGPAENPEINGEISLKEARIYVKNIDSEIRKIEGEAKIENSQLKISRLTGIWQGGKTRDYPNFLGMAGTIDLQRIFSENKMVKLNLSFTPSLLYVDFPNLYTGTIKIEEAQLHGPLYFDFSSGPTLRGKAEARHAVVTLTRRGSRPDKVFPLNFDLTVKLNKNVYMSMGDVATFDLSNIFMDLEIKSEELKISGSFASPSLLGKVFLKRGTVTIFNREFTLLSHESQKNYYPYHAEKVKDNLALFTGEKGPEGIMPDVTITAKVEVENLEEDESGEPVKKKVIILSRLQGVTGAAEKERGLKISFDSFAEDKTKAPYAVEPAGYSERDIKVMLLPDFIKSLTGITKGEEAELDTNLIVADYISSRFQVLVFRGIERELEQRLGLESLILEYNFGKDVRQAMGVKERRLLEGEKPDWRVGFVKGFFDRFYLDVNYAQFGTEAEIAQETFNYQLTYKLSRIWSIIYYREPISLQEPISGYEMYSLKAGFSF